MSAADVRRAVLAAYGRRARLDPPGVRRPDWYTPSVVATWFGEPLLAGSRFSQLCVVVLCRLID